MVPRQETINLFGFNNALNDSLCWLVLFLIKQFLSANENHFKLIDLGLMGQV